MTVRSIVELPVSGLAFLFSPQGLPLVDKGADQPTTSIAIFGDSGAGKTTLAVALSHAIARELGGTTLYLTTELAPTELSHKRELLCLNDFEILRWEHRAKASPSAFLTQHLALLEPVQEGPVSRRALQAAWELVRRQANDGATVRSVVIDAFPLFESADPAERDEVVALIQALESRGISVVIVQEAGGADYLPFVTDLAFELRFESDTETGELLRRLACRKSRYVRSLVGPHDTGLDSGKVAVWPDLLAVATTHALPRVENPARVFFPLGREDAFAVYRNGAIVLSTIRVETQLVDVLRATPGVSAISVSCGPVTRVACSGSDPRGLMVPEWEGPHSIGWAVRQMQAKSGANFVVFTGVSSLTERQRLRIGFQRILEALRMSGMLVCVHGGEHELQALGAMADFADSHVRGSAFFRRRYQRSAAAWLALWRWPKPDAHDNPLQTSSAIPLANAGGSPSEIRDHLTAILQGMGDNDSYRAMFAVAFHAIGADSMARGLLDGLTDKTGTAWANSLCGREWHAARAAFAGLGPGSDAETLDTLWAGFTAVHASNDTALDRVVASVAVAPAALDLAVRALAARDQWSEVDGLIDRTVSALDLPSFLSRRLHAEARLEGTQSVHWKDAAERLATLALDQTIPPVHRAMVFHNLGVAWAKCGALSQARRAWQDGLKINSDLEISRELLDSNTTLS